MNEHIKSYLQDVSEFNSTQFSEIESFRIKYLSKKGIVPLLFKAMGTIPSNKRREYGQAVNNLKEQVNQKIRTLQAEQKNSATKPRIVDLTRPGFNIQSGNRHPISIVRNKMIEIFGNVGFGLSEGPEIEDDWHNFSALNFPKHHPARDMQDTFYLQRNPYYLLRTHTSSVQVRHMEENNPPIKIISPGRVFRSETITARSHCLFHQIEGLHIDKKISFADLKQTIYYFCESLFGNSKMRLRPSYFPFTEPSAEIDIYWGLKSEVDHRITKGTGWLEIMGCGMVDPNVLENCKIDPSIFSGYAFGLGIERIAMLLYQIEDIRLFYENDLRFLRQFKATL